MSKIFCCVIVCLLTVTGYAQTEFHVGVRTGLVLSDLKNTGGDTGTGIKAGLDAELLIKGKWVLRSGLLYSTKRNPEHTIPVFLNANDGYEQPYWMGVRLRYLELPLTFGYKIPLKEHISLIPEVGGYVAYGLNGHLELREPIGGSGFSWNPFKDQQLQIEGFPTIKAFKRVDAGLRLGVTGRIYKFGISLYHDFGLVNIHKSFNKSGKDVRTWTTVVGVSYLL